jgi:hypothetical protein
MLEGISDPETLEAMACREGLAIATNLLLQRIRLATDCINVVRNIEGDGKGLYGHILQEVNARVLDFQNVQFVHEGRSSNVDAHCLARSSTYLDIGRHVWLQSPPEDVCMHQNII